MQSYHSLTKMLNSYHKSMEETQENATQEAQPVETKEQESENPEVAELKKQIADQDEKIAKLGRTAREAKKEAKKSDSPKETNPDEFGLLQSLVLKSEGVKEEDEVELAKKIQKETKIPWDKLTSNKYFQSELEELRTNRANAEATSDVRGGEGVNQAKNTAEYWQKKGTPPTPEQVPDNVARRAIIKSMLANKGDGKKFYND